MLIVLGLGDPHGFVEIVIGESGIEDGVAVAGKVGRFAATGDGGPAVQEEDSHGDILQYDWVVKRTDLNVGSLSATHRTWQTLRKAFCYVVILSPLRQKPLRDRDMSNPSQPLLPAPWYSPHPEMQSHLFGEPVEDVLASTRVSRDDLRRWKEHGWISFDVEQLDELQLPLIWEIEFVRNMARSGLSDAQIDDFLLNLEQPYRFNPEFVAYHFSFGWVCPERHDADEVVEQHLDEWLDSLAENEDFNRLEQLQDRIALLLEGRPEESDD